MINSKFKPLLNKHILKFWGVFFQYLVFYVKNYIPIGDVNGDGGLNVLILGGAGGGGGAGKGGVTDPHGNGGNGGGDGIPESSGVSGDPFGGEISAKSPSLTGDVMSIWTPITSSSTIWGWTITIFVKSLLNSFIFSFDNFIL